MMKTPPNRDLYALTLLEKSDTILSSLYETLFPEGCLADVQFDSNEEMADIREREKTRKLTHVLEVLSGRDGAHRNPRPHLALIPATDDNAAIAAWLAFSRATAAASMRAYRKEIERFQSWAFLERAKPLSGLNEQDLREYEAFLAYPRSRHTGLNWGSDMLMDPPTGKEPSKQWAVKPYDSQGWRPFHGPLSRRSIEYAMTILANLYSYWSGVGYIVVNPLRGRKTFRRDKTDVTQRVLSHGTWRYLYRHLEQCYFDAETKIKRKPLELRRANQRLMIFTALYLLGVRLGELSAIRMSDFSRQRSTDGQEYISVRIMGKGGRERTIPVPTELMDVLAGYRHRMNTLPVLRRGVHSENQSYDVFPLQIRPSPDDDTTMIRSGSGTRPLTPNRLHTIVKDTMSEALQEYQRLTAEGLAPADVCPDELANATTAWMRHTSASHQVALGIDICFIQKNLGHASCDTTALYLDQRIDKNQWLDELRKFHN
jgi:integrase/recombinase XerC